MIPAGHNPGRWRPSVDFLSVITDDEAAVTVAEVVDHGDMADFAHLQRDCRLLALAPELAGIVQAVARCPQAMPALARFPMPGGGSVAEAVARMVGIDPPTAPQVTTPPRKVVQLVGVLGTSGADYLHALLDDGSVWERRRGVWYRVPGPPGTEPQEGAP